jgi:hypothetical protein
MQRIRHGRAKWRGVVKVQTLFGKRRRDVGQKNFSEAQLQPTNHGPNKS